MFTRKWNWLSKSNTKPKEEVGFGLYLGCEKEINTIDVRNSNHDYKSTKKFKVSASNSSSRDTSETQIIFDEINLNDTRKMLLDDIPILRFHFENTVAQYVFFHLLEYYGNQGGGLNYFNILQDLNEYIKQTANFPSLSYDDNTGHMCDVKIGQKLHSYYHTHKHVSSWGECLRRCLPEPDCYTWVFNPDNGICRLGEKNNSLKKAPNYPDLVSGSWQCELFYIFRYFVFLVLTVQFR